MKQKKRHIKKRPVKRRRRKAFDDEDDITIGPGNDGSEKSNAK